MGGESGMERKVGHHVLQKALQTLKWYEIQMYVYKQC